MAHNYVTTGNRLTMGSQGGAGIINPDKIPYETSINVKPRSLTNLKFLNHCFLHIFLTYHSIFLLYHNNEYNLAI